MFDPDAIDGPDEEREGPSDEDLARFGYAATATVRCYECGRQLHEEATICPACGAFQISDDDLPAHLRPHRPISAWKIAIVAIITFILASGALMGVSAFWTHVVKTPATQN